MHRYRVTTPEEALLYITDCNLATVQYLASLKNKSKSEFSRQISIAQKSCNWLKEFGIDSKGTRAEDIINKTTVKNWIKPYERKNV